MKFKAWIPAWVLAICLLGRPATAGPWEDAVAVYRQGDYATI